MAENRPPKREASEPRYRVEVPSTEYWREQIKCQQACPVHTDARGYVREIAAGRFERAYLIARGPNPLASICGRVCAAPCEVQCRRGDYDKPITIRALKRFICDRFGPEKRPEGGKQMVDFLLDASRQYEARECQGPEELLPLLQSLTDAKIPKAKEKSVGIIGSGPAGLAAAHDLALLGFSVTIYEMEPVLGGMLMVGIPEYRLPRDLIRAEVEVVLSLGVEAVTNCCVGRDVSFEELRGRHDAVIVAVGAKRSRRPPIPGSDAKGVVGGVEFLRDASLDVAPELGRRVVVIGGGDVAMDSARTALRVTAEGDEDAQPEQYVAVDTARAASQMGGKEISVVYRRSRAEMPARLAEIYEAEEEGIRFHLLTNPASIEKDDQGRVRGMWCRKMELGEPDSSGRRRPVPIEGSDFFMECDNVLLAIGQDFDLSFLDADREGVELTDGGQIVCNPVTGTTSNPEIFVAGDLAYGTKLLIDAVASGKSVARTVYTKLTGNEIALADLQLHFPLPEYERETGYEKRVRATPALLPVGERLAGLDRMVEKGLTVEQACAEAGRCFDCGVNTIFHGGRCILCGGCVDVCPEECLRIVALDQIGDQMGGQPDLQRAVSGQLDGFPAEMASAIIKDETVCIRCGLCAERCPTGAITMEQFRFEETLQCPRS